MTAISSASPPEQWLQGHGDALFRFAHMRVRDHHVAEDLVQETLLAAWRGRHRFAAESSERTWLTGILKHKLADHWRRAARRIGADDEWRAAPSPWPGPDGALELEQLRQMLVECIAALPPVQARAFTLREFDGLGPDEICNLLEVTPGNLWVLLHRARARLRQSLAIRSDTNRRVT